jgi:hypothetical protein
VEICAEIVNRGCRAPRQRRRASTLIHTTFAIIEIQTNATLGSFLIAIDKLVLATSTSLFALFAFKKPFGHFAKTLVFAKTLYFFSAALWGGGETLKILS